MSRQPIPPVILIAGPARHGKTAAREILCKLTHLKGESCSKVIYTYLALTRGVTLESLKLEDKETLRPELIAVGNWLCGDIGELKESVGPDAPAPADVYRVPSGLIRTLYHNGYNVIDGVRRKLELRDALDKFGWNGLRVLSLWVVQPNGPVIADNTEDLSGTVDEVVVNDGTLEDLEKKLIEILTRRFPA